MALSFMRCGKRYGLDYKKLRYQMVEEQIALRGIRSNSVVEAMQKVKRHLFVFREVGALAYADTPLSIGFGQTISQPYMVGIMTELLDVDAESKVLEIGTGSGYQAAVLAEICQAVYSIEIIKPLARKAKLILEALNYKNLFLKHGEGYHGWEEHAPFDAIIVTCSPRNIPEPLIDQLKEGGRMVIPVGAKEVKNLVLLKKIKGKLSRKNIMPVSFVPMVDKEGNEH